MNWFSQINPPPIVAQNLGRKIEVIYDFVVENNKLVVRKVREVDIYALAQVDANSCGVAPILALYEKTQDKGLLNQRRGYSMDVAGFPTDIIGRKKYADMILASYDYLQKKKAAANSADEVKK